MDQTKEQNIDVKNAYQPYYIYLSNVKTLKEAVENGTAPFLSDNESFNTKPIYNINNGVCVNDLNLLLLKCKQNEFKFESSKVGTFSTLNKAKTVPLQKNYGLSYTFQDSKTKEYKTARFYFPEEVKSPESLNNINMKIMFPHKLTDKTINVEKGSDYLAAYFAACESGVNLNISDIALKEFKEEFVKVAQNNLTKNYNNEIPTLKNYCITADIKAKEIMKSLNVSNSIEKENKSKGVEKTKSKNQTKSKEEEIEIF